MRPGVLEPKWGRRACWKGAWSARRPARSVPCSGRRRLRNPARKERWLSLVAAQPRGPKAAASGNRSSLPARELAAAVPSEPVLWRSSTNQRDERRLEWPEAGPGLRGRSRRASRAEGAGPGRRGLCAPVAVPWRSVGRGGAARGGARGRGCKGRGSGRSCERPGSERKGRGCDVRGEAVK